MSLTYTQSIDLLTDMVKTNTTSYSLADQTRDLNLALDQALAIIFEADGRWNFNDSGHAGYPEVTANIVNGTRRYSFTTDASTNLILAIHKVMILPSATATVYKDLIPVDSWKDDAGASIRLGDTTTGVPSAYDKTGQYVEFDVTPNYAATNGIKLLVDREASYFLVSDTTKKSGIAGIFHEYLVKRAAYEYACRNDYSAKTLTLWLASLDKMEKQMKAHYAKKAQDERTVMTPRITPYI